MNDQWIKSFLLSVECGSFAKAAKASFISSTALTQQINLFEKELGFAVFYRCNSGLALTPAGESFLQTARELQQIYENGRKKAAAIAREHRPSLRFGFAPYQFPEQWLTLLGEFHSENPDIPVRMIPVPMLEQIRALQTGRIDVCILAKPKKSWTEGLGYINLLEDTYSFCMNSRHPLAKKKQIAPEDLQGFMVTCGSYPYMEQSFEEGLRGIAEVRSLSSEYDLGARFDLGTSGNTKEELFVIHSKWREAFAQLHRVVDSDISAGNVGFVYRRGFEPQVRVLCRFFHNYM